MRTNIVIDDDLMQQAMMLTKIDTKKAVVETSLKTISPDQKTGAD